MTETELKEVHERHEKTQRRVLPFRFFFVPFVDSFFLLFTPPRPSRRCAEWSRSREGWGEGRMLFCFFCFPIIKSLTKIKLWMPNFYQVE